LPAASTNTERTSGAAAIAACASPRPALAFDFFAVFAIAAPPRASLLTSLLRRQGADRLGTHVAMVSSATRLPSVRSLSLYYGTIKVDLLAQIAAAIFGAVR
jgi:hypothetical protein